MFLAVTVSALSLYMQAVDTMTNLPQPAYVTYRLEGTSHGLKVSPTVDEHGQVWLAIGPGRGDAHWTLRHRTFDYESEIVNAADGHRYVSARSFFDPTWYGAYRALHEGMLNAQDPAPPRTLLGATPEPAPALKTIAVASVMGSSVYDVQDRGPATCSNGDPGREMHLRRKDHNPQHQLTDVIVDTQSMRFCMMRFIWNGGFGFSGTVEEHYADVGGYWMQTDGSLDGRLRIAGISTANGIWNYKLLDMQFPASLPPEAFTP